AQLLRVALHYAGELLKSLVEPAARLARAQPIDQPHGKQSGLRKALRERHAFARPLRGTEKQMAIVVVAAAVSRRLERFRNRDAASPERCEEIGPAHRRAAPVGDPAARSVYPSLRAPPNPPNLGGRGATPHLFALTRRRLPHE